MHRFSYFFSLGAIALSVALGLFLIIVGYDNERLAGVNLIAIGIICGSIIINQNHQGRLLRDIATRLHKLTSDDEQLDQAPAQIEQSHKEEARTDEGTALSNTSPFSTSQAAINRGAISAGAFASSASAIKSAAPSFEPYSTEPITLPALETSLSSAQETPPPSSDLHEAMARLDSSFEHKVDRALEEKAAALAAQDPFPSLFSVPPLPPLESILPSTQSGSYLKSDPSLSSFDKEAIREDDEQDEEPFVEQIEEIAPDNIPAMPSLQEAIREAEKAADPFATTDTYNLVTTARTNPSSHEVYRPEWLEQASSSRTEDEAITGFENEQGSNDNAAHQEHVEALTSVQPHLYFNAPETADNDQVSQDMEGALLEEAEQQETSADMPFKEAQIATAQEVPTVVQEGTVQGWSYRVYADNRFGLNTPEGWQTFDSVAEMADYIRSHQSQHLSQVS